jgi:hypothetical protein
MLSSVERVYVHDLTKHHSTKDEFLSNFLVLCKGSHVQSTSDDV